MFILFIAYTPFVLMDYQILTSPEFEIDSWGGIYSLILSVYLLIVWGNRIKENRIRIHILLPVSQNISSLNRFWLASIHYFAILFYLILAHMIIIDNWHLETGSMIGQVGFTLIMFAGLLGEGMIGSRIGIWEKDFLPLF